MRVLRPQPAMMQPDCSIRDREAQPDPSGGVVARPIHAEERLKDFGESVLGDARAVIAHRDLCDAGTRLEAHFHGRPTAVVANRVLQDVLYGSPQQLAISTDRN